MPYKAFISYSHAADGGLASALQDGLQQFAKPWYRLRGLHVFRDATSLAASSALWPAIERALADAEYFLLMASPASAASEWVGREITWWLNNRSADRLLIIQTDGDLVWDAAAHGFDPLLSTAVPVALHDAFAQEPLWLDLRWSQTLSDISMTDPRLRDAIGDLAATLHGRPKDELVGEDVRQHRRRRRLAQSAVSALVALTIASGIGAWIAVGQRERALAALQRGDDLIQYMLYELRDRLQPIGQLDLLEDVNERAMAYYDSFGNEAQTVDTLRRQGAGLFNRSQVLLARGKLQGALEANQASIAKVEAAIEQAPDRILLHANLAALNQAAGDLLVRMGDSDAALANYQRAGQRIQTFLRRHPGNPRLLRHLSVSHERSGDVLIAQGRLGDAHRAYHRSLEITEQLATLDAGKPLVRADLGMAHDKLGRVLLAMGDVEDATDAYRRALRIFAALGEGQPDDARWQAHIAMSKAHLADALADGGQPGAAVTFVGEAIAGYERLVTRDPANSTWQRDLIGARNTLGNISDRRGDWQAARAAYQAAAQAARALAAGDPTNSEWQRDLAIALGNEGRVSAAHGALDAARSALEQSLDLREKLAALDPNNLRWQADLADGYAMLAEPLVRQGKEGAALELLQKALTIDRQLVERQPGNLQWLEALGSRHHALCRGLDLRGERAAATAACTRALEIARQLAEGTPGDRIRQSHLARSYSGLAEHHARHGGWTQARQALEAARDTLTALIDADPQSTPWQENLAAVQQRLSDVMFKQQNYVDGLKAFQAALRMRTTLAEQDPQNRIRQRALALAYERAADIAVLAMDNDSGALGLYRRSFKIFHEARQRAPTDLRNLMDLAAVITKMGDLFWRQQAHDKALTAYQDAVQLQRSIVEASDNQNDARQVLAERLSRLGSARFARRQTASAVASFEAARALLVEVLADNAEQVPVLIDLGRTTEQLGTAKLQAGDASGALTAYRALGDIFDRLMKRQPEAPNWVLGRSNAERLIADALLTAGDVDAAKQHFDRAVASLEEKLSASTEPMVWRTAIAGTALHAGKAVSGAAARRFLVRSRAGLKAMAAHAPLGDEQRRWLAEINALLDK